MHILPHSDPSCNFSLAENLASLSLQDGATKWYYFQTKPYTRPTNRPADHTDLNIRFLSKCFLIGLRSTCAVARVVMNTWDVKWKEKLDQNNITIKKGDRYMDDLRAFLSSIREGWRWHEGRLCYCELWKEVDVRAGLSGAKGLEIPSCHQ